MTWAEYRYLLLSDLYRVTGRIGWRPLLYQFLLGEGFKYNFWMRSCVYLQGHALLRYLFYPIARLWLRRLTYRLGISISPHTRIDSGFYIGHFGGIVINARSVIGRDVNLSHGVTLGKANRGRNKGAPIIGDRVYIGPGVKIVGAVRVGNDVAIGANCVVTADVPDGSVVVGVPGRVIAQTGSEGYINRIEYDKALGGRPTSLSEGECRPV